MKNFLEYYVLVIFFLIKVSTPQGSCPQGWTKWLDEKCYLLVSSFSNYQEAKLACASRGGLLANLKAEELQTFISDYAFNISAIDIGVWIGGTRVRDTEFQWEDGAQFSYTNWAAGSPASTGSGTDCVMMRSAFSNSEVKVQGTWTDEACSSQNFFVCERVPTWTLDEVLVVLIETRQRLGETEMKLEETTRKLEETTGKLEETTRKLEETTGKLEETTRKLEETTGKLENLANNPVPIGYIYTQLPGKPEPSQIWPVVQWKDVTAEYAGKFFRALGGGSAGFGETQNADSPRLTSVRVHDTWSYGNNPISIPAGSWSSECLSGDKGLSGENLALDFLVSNPENRPINMGIKMWARVDVE